MSIFPDAGSDELMRNSITDVMILIIGLMLLYIGFSKNKLQKSTILFINKGK